MKKLDFIYDLVFNVAIPLGIVWNALDKIGNAQTDFDLLRVIAYNSLFIFITIYFHAKGKKNEQ